MQMAALSSAGRKISGTMLQVVKGCSHDSWAIRGEGKMKPLPIVFLVAGLLFPVLSLLTGIASLIDRWKREKHSSPVFIPVIGPALLTAWVVLSHYPFWLIPVVWVGDIGTMAFLIISPRLISEWWDTCSYTRILNLHGINENQSAQLSFHATGRYLLRKKWQRPPDEVGIVSLGELGSFTRAQDLLEMKADHGVVATPRSCFRRSLPRERGQRGRRRAPGLLCRRLGV